DGFEPDVVRVNVVGLLPAERLHRGVRGVPYAARLGADDRVLAVGLVPDRYHFDACFRREDARAELRLRLVCEPVADADGALRGGEQGGDPVWSGELL